MHHRLHEAWWWPCLGELPHGVEDSVLQGYQPRIDLLWAPQFTVAAVS